MSIPLPSGMTEGLGTCIAPFVGQTNLCLLLLRCMSDGSLDVRQSSYALIGDLAKAAIGPIRPMLPQYLPVLTAALDPDHISVCNNASWAIGEIAIQMNEGMRE